MFKKLILLTCTLMAPIFSVAKENPIKVAILMFDDVDTIDFAGPYEIFGQAGFEVFTVNKYGNQIKTVRGLKTTADYSFSNSPHANIIVVPGGRGARLNVSKDKDTEKWLKQKAKETDYLLSICTGSDILAAYGFLDGLSATTFHKHIEHFKSMYPKINVQGDKRFVDNGKVITSAGLTSGMDASLYLVSKIEGMDAAKTVALDLEYNWDTDGKFVRYQMADRLIPLFDIEFPENTDFFRLSSFGDKNSWQVKYRIISKLSLQGMMELFSKAIDRYPSWSSVMPQVPTQKLWHYRENGQTWQLELENAMEAKHTQLVKLSIYKIAKKKS